MKAARRGAFDRKTLDIRSDGFISRCALHEDGPRMRALRWQRRMRRSKLAPTFDFKSNIFDL
ncbi:hypothetical protein [Burkholderia territorii]|uniref:hypothetical protein n=1 Tax=Burkholderia territorii TaxID=1503055 RepID=UPI0007570012|nr:hypothetical protein [Burkholderia territorii]KVQ58010.1 hypothetical protein WT23_27240 [Burkholderia territorii]